MAEGVGTMATNTVGGKYLFDYPNGLTNADKATALLNEARELLEQTTEVDLQDAADDIGPILLAIEDWQRKQSALSDG
jgi:hypothetical protein